MHRTPTMRLTGQMQLWTVTHASIQAANPSPPLKVIQLHAMYYKDLTKVITYYMY